MMKLAQSYSHHQPGTMPWSNESALAKHARIDRMPNFVNHSLKLFIISSVGTIATSRYLFTSPQSFLRAPRPPSLP